MKFFKDFKEKVQEKFKKSPDYILYLIKGEDLLNKFNYVKFGEITKDKIYAVMIYDIELWAEEATLEELKKLKKIYEKEPKYPLYYNHKSHYPDSKGTCNTRGCGFDFNFSKELNSLLYSSKEFCVMSKGSELTFLVAPKSHITNYQMLENGDFYEFIEKLVQKVESFKLEIDYISLNFGKWESRNSYEIDNEDCHGHCHVRYKEKNLKFVIENDPKLFPQRLQKTTYIKEDLNILENVIIHKRMDKMDERMDKMSTDLQSIKDKYSCVLM